MLTDIQKDEHDRLLHMDNERVTSLKEKQVEAHISYTFVIREHTRLSAVVP
jgi:hypothetical protein